MSIIICRIHITLLLLQHRQQGASITPYQYGYTIDSIPPVYPLYPDLTCRKKVYQCIAGCINWLFTCTHPNIAPALTFLSSYSNDTHPQHYKAFLHVLKYLAITN